MNTISNWMPVRVIFPDGKHGIRHANVINPRLINGVVVATATIENKDVRVALDEIRGEYYPCDENIKEIRLQVASTSRTKKRLDRGKMRFI